MSQLTNNQNSGSHIKVAYCGNDLKPLLIQELCKNFSVVEQETIPEFEVFLFNQSILSLPEIIILEVKDENDEPIFNLIKGLKNTPLTQGLIIVLLSKVKSTALKTKAMNLKVHDLYSSLFPVEDLCERLNFLVKFKLIKPKLAELSKVEVMYKMPAAKRIFDLLLSGGSLLVLSPFLVIIALIIKLESKGNVIYKSKRVGSGYKIFDFYKFRSMRSGADEELKVLSEEGLNQYDNVEGENKTAFVKIKNDPRVTKFGMFLRRTSIDELPQLFNVLKGDMSIVGNRPLPLYEAEMLTSNEWSMRFLGPAGLTGLWQISKRGKDDMSERERKKLDNFYAQKHSFRFDLKIIIGTLPALLQKEKV